MRQTAKQRLRGLALRLLIGGAVALAATQAPAKESPAPEKPVSVNSLAGAFLAARTAENDNDLDAAVRYYGRALSFDPDNAVLQQSMMLTLIAAGRFKEALPYAEKLKTVAEVERYSRLALGADAIKSGKYGDAKTWLKLALSSDLDNLITGIMTGWAMAGDKQPEDAISHVMRLEGPGWFTLFKNYHVALIADVAGLEEADRRYKTVIADRASAGAAPDTWFRAIEAYVSWLARAGRKDDALKVIADGLEVSPDRLGLLDLKQKVETGKPARPQVDSPAEGSAELLLDLATALNRGGGESFVRLYLQYANYLNPGNDAILIQLGQVAEQIGKPEEAIGFYAAIPNASPLKRMATLQQGLNLADLERTGEAVTLLKSAIEQDPSDMRAYLALGGVYSSQEDYASGAELYDRAAAILENPTRSDWNIFYQRGIAYERLKRWDKAEPNFRKALELYPDQPQVLNYLGYSWIDMHINLDEGMELIRKAVEQKPEDGYIVDSLGWAHYRLKQYDDAVRELERAVQLRPEDPTINDHLGDAYWRAGRKLEATFQWRQARDLKPDDDLKAAIEKKLAEGLADDDDGATAKPEAKEPGNKG